MCKGMPVWADGGVALLMHKTCYCEIAANLQRPATGNWRKDRNHGELGTQLGQRAPPESRGWSQLVAGKVDDTQMLTLSSSRIVRSEPGTPACCE